MKHAILFFIIIFGASAFAGDEIKRKDCVVRLIRPHNTDLVTGIADLMSERSRGKKVMAIGVMEEFTLMMRAMGHRERALRLSSDAIYAVMGAAIQMPEFADMAISRVAKKLYEARGDLSKLAFCTLGKGCKFDIGRDAHVYLSRTVNFRSSADTKHGSLVVEARVEFPAGMKDPLHLIVLHYDGIRSGRVVEHFFHEASHFEITSALYKFVHAHADEIRSGSQQGILRFVTSQSDGFWIDEGFASVLLESQAEIVELELKAMAGRPSDGKKEAERLIKRFKEHMPPAAEFLRANGINATNILAWSRQIVNEIVL
jgi:hypothetical protein